MKRKISIVIPAYNEQMNVQVIVKALVEEMHMLPYNYEIIIVDDGSKDNTLTVLREMAKQYENLVYIGFSRNFGHQYALKAGLDMACGDAVIMMDADMQHPPTLIPEMLFQWENGNDVVYTIRKNDKALPFFKRVTSKLFYKFINFLSDVKLEPGTADFRLIDRKVVDVIKDLNEYDLFMRGIFKWVGFQQLGIEYKSAERQHGTSQYTFKKMMRLALNGITSFSTKPLYYAVYLGLFFSLLSFLYVPYVLYSYYFGHPISGWASLIVSIAFFGGLQLMMLGILGIYVGRVFVQSKERPQYIVKETNHGKVANENFAELRYRRV